MGYYTSYSLFLTGPDEQCENFKKDLLKVSAYENGDNDPDIEQLIKSGGVWAKLYELEDWISELAPKYPNLLICLEGDGEESDDTWEIRWKGKNAEKQFAVIPPFTNKELWTEEELNEND